MGSKATKDQSVAPRFKMTPPYKDTREDRAATRAAIKHAASCLRSMACGNRCSCEASESPLPTPKNPNRDAAGFKNQLAVPTISIGHYPGSTVPRPEVALRGLTKSHRITTSIAFMLAAELERRTPAAERWIVGVDRSHEGAIVWLELADADKPEVERALALLELTVSEAL